ncbi:helix-turn-helix domain-containing protein [Marinitoga lauensis]|uniref:helix-turn-helix domain-containing protein n=1 Tax=Marinitoga lauensis TaxID=2201189 RepID=UPI001013954D|nr:helix-turn-helix domain-containing protein [Marinitoga lauensis]
MIELEGIKFFTLKETGSMLNKHPETIRRWIKEKKLKSYKVGNVYYIKEEDIKNILFKQDTEN